MAVGHYTSDTVPTDETTKANEDGVGGLKIHNEIIEHPRKSL